MRVLHIVSNLSIRNGIMSVVMNYYRNIDKNKFQFDFLYFDDRELTYESEINKLGGNVYKVEHYTNNAKLFINLRKILKKSVYKYDIIHLHEIYLVGLLFNLKKYNNDLKIIVHSHSTQYSDHLINSFRNKILSFPKKVIPDYYFACSYDAGINIFGKIFLKKGCIINNAINLSNFCYDRKKEIELRKKYGLVNKFVIGHVGNFNYTKNQKFLVEVFYHFQMKKSDAMLVFVGDGKTRKDVLLMCEKLGIDDKVLFLGARNDVYDIMNIFDCFVFPSIYEGLGLVLIEAQAVGVPCVFSDKVPKEANILKNSNKVISLKDSYKIWIDAINDISNIHVDNPHKAIELAGYDISIETKKLEDKYNYIIGIR